MALAAQSPGSRAGAVLTAIAWIVVNVLLAVRLGDWLWYTGAACAALGVVVVGAGLWRRDRLRQISYDLLLVLTLANFNGWAFSHLGNLPFFIGLFFFALFGLIMGAAPFRFLAAFRPVHRLWVVVGGATVVLISWGGSLVLEADLLQRDAALYTRAKISLLPEELTPDELEESVRAQMRDELARYHAEPTVGYLRWALSEGRIELHVSGAARPLVFEIRQRRVGLALRLVMSLVLLCYGVFSQIGWLHTTEEEARRFKTARAQAKTSRSQTAA